MGTVVHSPEWGRGNGTSLKVANLVSGTRQGRVFKISSSAQPGPFFFRVYGTVPTRPSAENKIAVIASGDSAATTQIAWVTLGSDGALRLYDEDGQIGSASPVIPLDTEYRLDLRFDRSGAAGAHVVRARLDGVEFAGSATRDLSNGLRSLTVDGNLGGEAQTVGTWYFTDAALNDGSGTVENSYPADGTVTYLRPNVTASTPNGAS